LSPPALIQIRGSPPRREANDAIKAAAEGSDGAHAQLSLRYYAKEIAISPVLLIDIVCCHGRNMFCWGKSEAGQVVVVVVVVDGLVLRCGVARGCYPFASDGSGEARGNCL